MEGKYWATEINLAWCHNSNVTSDEGGVSWFTQVTLKSLPLHGPSITGHYIGAAEPSMDSSEQAGGGQQNHCRG